MCYNQYELEKYGTRECRRKEETAITRMRRFKINEYISYFKEAHKREVCHCHMTYLMFTDRHSEHVLLERSKYQRAIL